MKTKLFLLSFLMLLTVATTFAQITPAGIAVQGIARDDNNNNNTARVSATIPLNFILYSGCTETQPIICEVNYIIKS